MLLNGQWRLTTRATESLGGGSYGITGTMYPASNRISYHPDRSDNGIGFRPTLILQN